MVPSNQSPKLLVVGPGAIGCAVAGSLVHAGVPTKFLGREHHKEHFASQPVVYHTASGKRKGQVDVLTISELKDAEFQPDYVLITLKTNHTMALVKELSEIYEKSKPIISVQNGLIAYDIADSKRFDNVFGCVVGFNVKTDAQGVSTQTSEGTLTMGRVNGKSDDVPQDLVTAMENVAPVIVSNSVEGDIWMKVLINSVINPLSAIGDCTLGDLANSRESVFLCLWAWKEMVDVAMKHGIELNPFEGKLFPEVLYVYDIISYAIGRTVLSQIVRPHRNAIVSMLQDIRGGRATEIDFLNGKILEIGKSYGMDLPVNELLVTYIKKLEKKEAKGGRGLINKFYKAVLDGRTRNATLAHNVAF